MDHIAIFFPHCLDCDANFILLKTYFLSTDPLRLAFTMRLIMPLFLFVVYPIFILFVVAYLVLAYARNLTRVLLRVRL